LARQLDEPAGLPLEPPSIPDHALLRCIGEGACGEVWLARNALGTFRAVKIVYRAWFDEDRPYEREFDGILKYEPISRTHEGLVQVLHVGRNDQAGCFYYVMELADAEERAPTRAQPKREGTPFPSDENPSLSPDQYRPRTLRSELARRERLAPTEAAQFTLRLAQALAFLHDQGLVHRDIKPSNVIFVCGQPKLADIGLVTNVGSSRSFVGTEGFIPPEGPGTPQADLYALGKLLYELATGRDRLDFPQLPPRVHEMPEAEALLELNEVVTRACAPNPAERYTTATQLQAELDFFLAGRSLRRARHVERYLARVKQFAAVVCVLLALTAAALWYSKREARQARERAQGESVLRERAEIAERATEQQLYTALLEQARATVRSRDLGQRVRALDAIRQAAAISNSVELRREVLSALLLPDLRFEREVASGSENVMKWLDPKFERIAVGQGRGPVEIRAVKDERLLATLPASTNFMCYGVMWSRDGRFLAVRRDYPAAGHRGDLEVWKVDEARQVLLIRDTWYNARTWHPHKPQLLTASADGWISAWDLDSEKEVSRGQFQATPEILNYSPEGNRVAASYNLTNECGVSIHRAADGALLTFQVISNRVSSVDWHPAGRWVAITDYSGDVHLLDSHNGELRALGRHKAEATYSLFSPDGNYLLTGGWERELICWDMRTMEQALTIAADSYVAQFRADGQACGLFSLSGMKLHSFERPTAHRWFAEDLGPRLRHAAFSPDGRWLAASAGERVGVWDLAANASGALTDGVPDVQLFWTQAGNELFGSGRGDKCFRWRIEPAENASLPPALRKCNVYQPDGALSLNLTSNRIVWTGSKGSLLAGLEESGSGEEQWRDTIQGVSGISPDNRWLAIFRPFGMVLNVYRLPGLEPVAQLTNQARIAGFSFSPSGEEIGVGSRGQIEFWSTLTWERTRCATNYVGLMDVGLIYQPDGRALWLAQDSRTAGLFDARTLKPIFFLPTGRMPLAVDAAGRQLAVAVDAQRLEVWNLAAVRKQFRELGLDWQERDNVGNAPLR
jgi:WD40 repeat protein